jgi:opacity protein-like surface antigen
VSKPRATRWFALALGLSALLNTQQAASAERQWQLGASFGYALAGFPGGPVSGLGGGAQLGYGLTDWLNARVHFDVTGYDLPDPGSGAIIYNGGVGVEAAFDVLQLVPYVGLTVGPADVSIVDGDDLWHWSIEVPGGLRYQVTRSFHIGVEARYRALVFGKDDSPAHNLIAGATAAYVWGF